MNASNAVCPSCPPVPLEAARPDAAAWSERLATMLRRWRAGMARPGAAKLARSLSPAMRRDLGLHEASGDAPDVHAHAQSEYERMRW
jgi:hypothetical protein